MTHQYQSHDKLYESTQKLERQAHEERNDEEQEGDHDDQRDELPACHDGAQVLGKDVVARARLQDHGLLRDQTLEALELGGPGQGVVPVAELPAPRYGEAAHVPGDVSVDVAVLEAVALAAPDAGVLVGDVDVVNAAAREEPLGEQPVEEGKDVGDEAGGNHGEADRRVPWESNKGAAGGPEGVLG
eukprot:764969-Hanusia_phi.AAC.2